MAVNSTYSESVRRIREMRCEPWQDRLVCLGGPLDGHVVKIDFDQPRLFFASNQADFDDLGRRLHLAECHKYERRVVVCPRFDTPLDLDLRFTVLVHDCDVADRLKVHRDLIVEVTQESDPERHLARATEALGLTEIDWRPGESIPEDFYA